jgi:hypothetical protein
MSYNIQYMMQYEGKGILTLATGVNCSVKQSPLSLFVLILFRVYTVYIRHCTRTLWYVNHPNYCTFLIYPPPPPISPFTLYTYDKFKEETVKNNTICQIFKMKNQYLCRNASICLVQSKHQLHEIFEKPLHISLPAFTDCRLKREMGMF